MTVPQLFTQGVRQHSDHYPEPQLVTLRSLPVLGIHTRTLTPHRYRTATFTHTTAPMHPKDFCGSSTHHTSHALSTHSTGSHHAANRARSSAVAPGVPWYSSVGLSPSPVFIFRTPEEPESLLALFHASPDTHRLDPCPHFCDTQARTWFSQQPGFWVAHTQTTTPTNPAQRPKVRVEGRGHLNCSRPEGMASVVGRVAQPQNYKRAGQTLESTHSYSHKEVVHAPSTRSGTA